MPRFNLEKLPWDCLILRPLTPGDPPQPCATCGEDAVQEFAARGIALTYYFCLLHAIAREA